MLFNKKADSQASDSKSSRVELLTSSDGLKAIAFGLSWRSVATGGGKEAAEKLVRRGRASHWIYRGQQIGFGVIAGKPADLPLSIYPASLVAAKHFAGDSVYVVQIDGDGQQEDSTGAYWICLIRNGSPTSTDRFVEGIDDAQALALARQVAAPLLDDGVSLTFFSNVEHSGIEDVRFISVEDLLDAGFLDEDKLHPVPKAPLSIPKPVLGVVGVALALLVGKKALDFWDERKRASLAESNMVVEEDPVVAWTRSIDQWAKAVSGPNPDGLVAVRTSLAQVPVRWDGWILQRSQCNRQPSDAALADKLVTNWSCSAHYVRSKAGILARELAPRVPSHWKVTFIPIDQMKLVWSVEAPRDQLDIGRLPRVEHHNIETVSALQAFLPALSDVAPFTFSPVKVPAPMTSAGVPFPADDRVMGLVEAPIAVRGPLRSVDALLHARLDVAWDSLTMTYAPATPEVTINVSAITAEVTGVLYANK
jgi:hypothetical protein